MREKIYINRDWKFYITNPKDTESETVTVTLPHTIKETPFHYFDESIYQLQAVYEKELDIPEEWKGKSVEITFEAIGHEARVYVNDREVAYSNCGYTSVKAEISDVLKYGQKNHIKVDVDARETLNQPPFGYVIDYMTYGGIYREAYLTVREKEYIADCFYKPSVTEDIDTTGWDTEKFETTEVNCTLETVIRLSDAAVESINNKTVELHQYVDDKEILVKKLEKSDISSDNTITLKIPDLKALLWDVQCPNLYTIKTELVVDSNINIDIWENSIGFRKSEFKANGYFLNGRRLKIRGLNRHQSYAYVGYAMPESMQRLDARILKNELGVNTARTSHYPQSHYFYDECDRLGILVLTEMPGWQHIGDKDWQDVAVKNVKLMIEEYRNHTCIITWGVRINESFDNEEFYKRTNDLAHSLDPTRPTSGVKAHTKGSDLEDIYTYNDFIHSGNNQGCHKKRQATSNMNKPYMVTEFNGHMFPTKAYDCEDHRTEHAKRHANVIDAVMGENDICGCTGWCMFDYNTHKDFGSGDRICYHGVMDMFRNPKMAAYTYAAEGAKDPVLHISSAMDIGEKPGCNRGDIFIFSNADSVKMYKDDELLKEYFPKDSEYRHMTHGPILINDYVGEQLEKEGFSKGKTKALKELLSYVGRFGLGMTPRLAFMGAKLIVLHHGNMEECTRLYNKYVGNWGGKSVKYRFDAIKDGKVVKTVIKSAASGAKIIADVSHTALVEKNTYDVAEIRINICDENDNVLNFFNDPIEIEVSDNIELIGPAVISASGGMTGVYVKSKGIGGEAAVTIKGQGLKPVEIKLNVEV